MRILMRKRNALVLALGLALALGIGVGTTLAQPGSPSAPIPHDELTPLTGHVIAAPHPVPTADGRVHLVYESGRGLPSDPG